MPLYKWSQTSSNNAGADPTINYAEGQAPSSLNDSARAAMAAIAMYRDDIAGAIVTGGSSTAYTVASYSGFDTLAHMSGQMIAFSPHVTNGATVLLNVDGLGQKPLRSSPGVELLAGTIIQGTPYVATYNNTDGAFYLQGFMGNPYNVPLAASLDFWGAMAPNSSFAFMFGQAVSRTTYAALFAIFGTTYGSGDGSTTFNLPDLRGRVVAGADNMGGTAAGRLTSASGMGTGLLGQVGGKETETLLTANLPPYTPAGTNGTSLSTAVDIVVNPAGVFQSQTPNGGGSLVLNGGSTIAQIAVNAQTFTGTAQGGVSTPVVTMPPAIVCNSILRII